MSPRKNTQAPPAEDLRKLRESAGLSQVELAQRSGYSCKTIKRWEAGDGSPRRAVMEYLQKLRTGIGGAAGAGGSPAFRFIDLFAGIGGLRRAFDLVGGKCVFTSEWDKYAEKTYRANFHCDHPFVGDILQIPSEVIPPHDVLVAGFPCQPFSIAGVSKKNALGRPHGFACETQGTLFFEVARILRHHRPPAFLLENVKNLVSHDGGRTFRTIRDVLTRELGYHVSWRVINARPFVPQHRQRIFIVGFRDRTDFSWDAIQLPDERFWPVLRSVLHPEDGTEVPEPAYTDADGKVLLKYRLSGHLWDYLRSYALKHRAKGNGFGFGLVGPDDIARTLSARYYKDGSEILISRGRRNPRRLTPRECARLMGFDQPGRSDFVIPVSDTQAYRQFGNSVVVPLAEAVARAMVPLVLGQPSTAPQLSLSLSTRSA
jgi:DNA (cytosine-5)-methyltransferase 1